MIWLAGQADAHLWVFPSVYGASSARYHELDVVWEDYQGTEEDFNKEAVMGIVHTR